MKIKNYQIIFWKIFDFEKESDCFAFILYKPYFQLTREFPHSDYYIWSMNFGYIEIRKIKSER